MLKDYLDTLHDSCNRTIFHMPILVVAPIFLYSHQHIPPVDLQSICNFIKHIYIKICTGKHVTLLWQTEQMVKEPTSAVYLLIQEAVSDGALLWLPHPACCLAHNKALFHTLSDPYFENLLPPSDSKFIKSIPFSR